MKKNVIHVLRPSTLLTNAQIIVIIDTSKQNDTACRIEDSEKSSKCVCILFITHIL